MITCEFSTLVVTGLSCTHTRCHATKCGGCRGDVLLHTKVHCRGGQVCYLETVCEVLSYCSLYCCCFCYKHHCCCKHPYYSSFFCFFFATSAGSAMGRRASDFESCLGYLKAHIADAPAAALATRMIYDALCQQPTATALHMMQVRRCCGADPCSRLMCATTKELQPQM